MFEEPVQRILCVGKKNLLSSGEKKSTVEHITHEITKITRNEMPIPRQFRPLCSITSVSSCFGQIKKKNEVNGFALFISADFERRRKLFGVESLLVNWLLAGWLSRTFTWIPPGSTAL